MLKVAICDDEQKDIDIAEKCILEYSFKHNLDIECANYRTGQELLDKMESGEHYDFFVFDVEMKKESHPLTRPMSLTHQDSGERSLRKWQRITLRLSLNTCSSTTVRCSL